MVLVTAHMESENIPENGSPAAWMSQEVRING